MKWLKWVLLLVWVFIICILSFSSLDKIQIKSAIGVDKVAHIGMYFILGILAFVAQNKFSIGYTILMLLSFLLAFSTEIVQHYFILNRTGDYADFVANTIGLVFAFLLMKRIYKT